MFIRCNTTDAVLYAGEYKTVEEFCEEFIPVNVDETGNITETFDKRTPDSVYIEYSEGEVDARARKLLAESDWIVTRANERNEAVPTEWVTYRDALRNLVGTTNTNITWPTKPA